MVIFRYEKNCKVGVNNVAGELVHQDPVQHGGALAQGTLRVPHYGGEGGQVADKYRDIILIKYCLIFNQMLSSRKKMNN